jgi:MFS family permease
LNDFLFAAGAIMMMFAKFFWLWILGRFLVGFGSGIGTIGMVSALGTVSAR